MSLLNDMLSDLDSSAPKLTPRKVGQPAKFTRRSVRQYWLPGLALVAILYFLIVEIDVFGVASKSQFAEKSMPGPVNLNEKWLKVEAPNSNNNLNQQDSMVEIEAHRIAENTHTREIGNTVDSVETQHSTSVEEETFSLSSMHQLPTSDSVRDDENDREPLAVLLAQAFQLLEADQLMTPVENNAYQYFKAVLAIESDNLSALQGVERIYRRYLDLATKAFQQGQVAKGNVFLQRAEIIAPIDQSEFSEIRSSVKAMSSPREITQPAASKNDLNIVVSTNHSDKKLAGMIRYRATLALEEQVFSRLDKGEALTASVIALANHYANSQNILGLKKLRSATKNEAAKHYISAQLAVIAGDFLLAQQELESTYFVESSRDQWRLRLLSAACQKNRDFECAISGYSQLVSSSSRQVNDWLGLAVALDGQGNINSALNAYKNVVDLIPSENRVSQFARQRISDLSSMSYSR